MRTMKNLFLAFLFPALVIAFCMQSASAADADAGAALYDANCKTCHGLSHPAKGKPVDAILAKVSAIKAAEGLSGPKKTMQDTLKKLTDAQAQDVAAYISAMK